LDWKQESRIITIFRKSTG
jgi:hypothetical protein